MDRPPTAPGATMSLERLTPLLSGLRSRSHSLGAMDHARPPPLTTPAGHTPDEGPDKPLTPRWPAGGSLTGSAAATIPPLSPNTSTTADARPPSGRVHDSFLFDTSPTGSTLQEDEKCSRLAPQRAPHTLASSADIVSAVLGGPVFVHAAQTHTVSPHRVSSPLITTPIAVKAGGLSASRPPPSAPAPAAVAATAAPAAGPREAESVEAPHASRLRMRGHAPHAGETRKANGKESNGKPLPNIQPPLPNIPLASSTCSTATRAPPKPAQGSPHSSGSLTRWLGWTGLGPTDGSPLASGWDKAVSDSQRRKVR
jgi:hypothetical protein